MKVLKIVWLVIFIGLGRLLSGCSYDAIDEQKHRIAVNPNDIWAYYNLGNVYKDLGRYEEAIVLNEFYVEFSKTDPFFDNIRQTPKFQQLIDSY